MANKGTACQGQVSQRPRPDLEVSIPELRTPAVGNLLGVRMVESEKTLDLMA